MLYCTRKGDDGTMNEKEKTTALESSAKRIVDAARRKLALELPDLLPVIYLLPMESCEQPGPLWTDGETLFYHPETVARTYLENKKVIGEQLIHILAHGLLGHYGKRKGQTELLFDAAADLKAADLISRLAKDYVHPRKWPQATRELMNAQRENSLEQVYLAPANSEEAKNLVLHAQPLHMDDHRFWGKPQSKRSGGGNGMAGKNLGELWEAARQQVAAGLNSKGKGDLAGELSEVYREAEESGTGYRDFLRRFMDISERVEIDPDSIDRILYHVGLELTGDVPLVEPEEVREDAGVLNLAVALDTSGSCHGEVMKQFLGELLAILRDSGGPRVEITLIQCDAEIQHVDVLTREDDADRILEGFETYGCGGTDFRPVFDYVDRCREDREDGKAFRGLLYLSDGCGDFPDKAPDYPVAFLLPREEDDWWWSRDMIPDWVTKVHIQDDGSLKIEETND